MTAAGATISVLPSWRCHCQKCETTTDWRCDCPAVDVEKVTFNGELRISVGVLHKKGCAAPERCPDQDCRSLRWWEPPRWRHGEGTSDETLRRRRLSRAAQRRKRR